MRDPNKHRHGLVRAILSDAHSRHEPRRQHVAIDRIEGSEGR